LEPISTSFIRDLVCVKRDLVCVKRDLERGMLFGTDFDLLCNFDLLTSEVYLLFHLV